MNTTGNTILVTGGGSGIGLATARLLADMGNEVIIAGRNEAKLAIAAAGHDRIHYRVCDISDSAGMAAFTTALLHDFPQLNIVINNAGAAYLNTLQDQGQVFERARIEMQTNYLAVVQLTALLLEHLQQQSQAALVNVSSIVAYAPSLALATYSASKAALHAYTSTLRLSLKGTTVQVFEVLPPLVDTELARDIPSTDKLQPGDIAEAIAAGLASGTPEIRMGRTAFFYDAFFDRSEAALAALNA